MSRPREEFGRRPGQHRVVEHFDAIVALIRGGMTGNEACSTRPEYPSYRSLSEWATKHGRMEEVRAAWQTREKSDAARMRTNVKYTDADWQAVLDVFERYPRKSQRDLDATLRAAGLPCRDLIKYKRRRDEAFDARFKAVANLKRKRAGRPDPAPPKPVYRSGQLRSALLRDPFFAAAYAAMPRTLDPDIKNDVVADIVLAVLSGAIHVSEIATQAQNYIRDHNRRFARADVSSLDVRVGRNEREALSEILTSSELIW